jgi:hypothetical protein
MGRALLVADQHVLQLRLVEQRVVDRQHRAARIAEQHIDALIEKGAHHDLRAGEGGLFGFDRLVGGHGLGLTVGA